MRDGRRRRRSSERGGEEERVGGGLEALRLLTKQHDPQTLGSKRALLKTLVNLIPCKRIGGLEAIMSNIEQSVRSTMSCVATKMNGKLDPMRICQLVHYERCVG